MIFGRGGGGGVVNRVTQAGRFQPVREVVTAGRHVSATSGSAADIDQPLGEQGRDPPERDVRGLRQLPR